MLTYPRKVAIHGFEKEGKKFLLDVRRSISMEIGAVWDDILNVNAGFFMDSVRRKEAGMNES